MTNPILAKSPVFSRGYRAANPAPANLPPANPAQYQGQPYPANPTPPTGYGQPVAYAPPAGYAQPYPYTQQPYAGTQPGVIGQPPPAWSQPPSTNQKVMTLDDVLTKTAITLGALIVVAALTMWLGQSFPQSIGAISAVGLITGLACVIFPLVAFRRRQIGPVLAVTFAVLEGVFIGAVSLIFELVYPGIVQQAVIATFVAAAITLAAFHFGKFRLSAKLRRIVYASMAGFVGVALVSLILSLFGVNLGLFPGPGQPVSWIAWLAALVGVVLAVLSLIDDFQYVEYGIQNRLPASESWRAAFGLTVTMVWLYSNLLRILAYIRH